MDLDAFTTNLFKWDPRTVLPPVPPMNPVFHPARAAAPRKLGELEELF